MVLQHNINKFEKTQNFDFFIFFQILGSNQELDLGSDKRFWEGSRAKITVLRAQKELGGPPQHVVRRKHPSGWVGPNKIALEMARNAPQTQLLFFPHLSGNDTSLPIFL